MAILTADQFAQQIIAQTRVLDPSISLEVGTPERKIVDAVSQSLAENQIDLTGLAGALDIDGKFGSNLDQFVSLFGFQRQQAAAATGFVVYSRTTPAPAAITIPTGSVVQSDTTTGGTAAPMQYFTVASGTIPINQTTSSYIPVQAVTTGTAGNAAVNDLTVMVGTPPPGVTAVTNPSPITNGIDVESDNMLKVRFKNTWARNLAGTEDQYLALALSSPYTTKASVLGIESRFQEYVQVPSYDDAGYLNGALTNGQNVLGIQGQWTTALSTIPYAKDIYTTTASYISGALANTPQFYYRSGIDFNFNYPAYITGDIVRELATTATGGTTASNTLPVSSTVGFPVSGTLLTYQGSTPTAITYTGATATTFTGVPNGIVVDANSPVYLEPATVGTQPNFTFLNVFNPSTPTTITGLQALTPGLVVLSEFSYLSHASRNDLQHNINNAVDVYVDGSNPTQASCVFLSNLQSNQQFNTNPNSPYYYENYRRDGNAAKRPQTNNYITPLFQSPLAVLPSSLIINNQTYYEGAHYWLVHEVGDLGGTVRARDAIEWSKLPGDSTSVGAPVFQTDTTTHTITGPQVTPYAYLGTAYSALPSHTGVSVSDYQFDANIVTLQATVENNRQITTDALVHKAITRYFKLDITVMYSSNANPTVVNAAIGTSVQAFFDRQYFGTVLQLSTLLEIIHEVSGVDNVRWSNDLPIVPNLLRVSETDVNGNALHGASVDRLVFGTVSSAETQTLYIVGNPVGSFQLSWNDPAIAGHPATTRSISFTDPSGGPVTAATIQTAIRSALSGVAAPYSNPTVTLDVRSTFGVTNPIRSFTITYANGTPYLPTVSQTITSSAYAFDADFFLLDNELPSLPAGLITGDASPGLIIRPRAQSTFYRPGLT